jgi:alpha-tubulin suppressor-like RCC1 family protein
LTYWGENVPNNYAFPSNSSTIIKIVAGGYHFAGIRNNGDVVCWGDSSNGKTVVPSGLTAVSVSAGVDHTCALKSDGTVVCWGRNNEGQISVPANLSGVVDIACGYRSTHALLQDNTVVSWGRNNNVSAQVYADKLNSLDLPQIVEISGVGDHLSVRTVDGSVYSVGRNNEGQCNNNLTNSVDLYQTHIGSYIGVVGQRKDNYAISNLNYEMNRNNKRRTIRLLHPRYKDQALRELDALLRV